MRLQRQAVEMLAIRGHSLLPKLSEAEKAAFLSRIEGDLPSVFLANGVMFKHPAYSFEQEFRMMTYLARERAGEVSNHQFRIRGGEIVHFSEHELRSDLAFGIGEIKLGPCTPPTLVGQFRGMLSMRNLDNIEVRRSTIPYRTAG